MRRSLSPMLLLLAALGAWPAAAQNRQPPVIFRGAATHPARHLARTVGASFFAPSYGDAGGAEAAAAPTVIVLAVAPPPAPLPPPAPASIETTLRGVTIFRGPEILEARR